MAWIEIEWVLHKAKIEMGEKSHHMLTTAEL